MIIFIHIYQKKDINFYKKVHLFFSLSYKRKYKLLLIILSWENAQLPSQRKPEILETHLYYSKVLLPP